VAEEEGRGEDAWQRREEEERMRGKEGRKSIDDTWQRGRESRGYMEEEGGRG
jgi:hypothetical protein